MRLGDVADIIRGVTFDAGDVSNEPSRGLLPILRAGNIQRELVLDQDLVWVPRQVVRAEQLLRVGDIAICTSSGSAALVGKSASLRSEFAGSVGAFCAIVRPTIINAEFLSLWFQSPDFLAWRASASRGVGIQNLRVSELSRAEIPVPTRESQALLTAIVRRQLDEAGRAADACLRRFGSASALRSRVYEQALQEFVPLSAATPGAQSPPTWAWHRLTHIARLESGHTPSRSRPDWWDGDVPWIQLADIRAVDGQVIQATSETTNAEGIAHSAARILPADTVVMSRTASVGFVARMGRPMATSQDFVNWVCGPDLDPEFLMHLLIRSRDYIRSLSAGAIHQTVYYPTVKNFHVCIPPIAEQRRIAAELRDRLATIDEMTRAIEVQREAIDALPAVLLRRAFAEIEAA